MWLSCTEGSDINRYATGPGSVLAVWRTKRQWRRLFAGTLAFAEVNAFKAYLAFACDAESRKFMTSHVWKNALSLA